MQARRIGKGQLAQARTALLDARKAARTIGNARIRERNLESIGELMGETDNGR